MSKRIDLTGKPFGSWTVVAYHGMNAIGQSTWWCRCKCGIERAVVAQTLRVGTSVSCGCTKAAAIAQARTKHGMAGTKAHNTWYDMVKRCTSPKAQRWADYGGRGIIVCAEWLVFENWYADMGDPPPGLSLERIDNDGGYNPGNCKWGTKEEQNRNRRRAIMPPRFATPEFRAWRAMRMRCSPNNKQCFKAYFGRGITVCDRWASFDAFLADMGVIPRPGLTLDRRNNDLGYSPDNCRWADTQAQANNRRSSIRNRDAA